MRILIADDSESIRRGITNLLVRVETWEICGEASNGPEAVEKARNLEPDLILLDLNMPGASGFQTAHLIRQESSRIKILIMSQNEATQFLPGALQAGADGCLDKSRLATELVRAVKSLLLCETPSPAEG